MSARQAPALYRFLESDVYNNIRDPDTDSHISQKTGLRGYGSRHVSDNAPFQSWDAENNGCHIVSSSGSWIMEKYNATSIEMGSDDLTVVTSLPPVPVPVTIGGIGVTFAPPNPPYTIGPLAIYHRMGNNGYAAPRMKDPISSWEAPYLMKPTRAQAIEIFSALSSLADIKAINFLGWVIVVELAENGRTYETRSLPGRVANRSCLYQHSNSPLFIPDAMDTDLAEVQEDMTNYIDSTGALSSGVRIEPGVAEAGQNAPTTSGTTAGAFLKNSVGDMMLTVSNRHLASSKEVYHPNAKDGIRLGKIIERWLDLDIAVLRLDSSITCSKESYFEATPPQHLLRSSEIAKGDWFSMDSIATGIMWLQCCGTRYVNPTRCPHYEFTRWVEETMFLMHGSKGNSVHGACGAPIVAEESGAVAGFFNYSSGKYCFAATLDTLIDEGWTVA